MIGVGFALRKWTLPASAGDACISEVSEVAIQFSFTCRAACGKSLLVSHTVALLFRRPPSLESHSVVCWPASGLLRSRARTSPRQRFLFIVCEGQTTWRRCSPCLYKTTGPW